MTDDPRSTDRSTEVGEPTRLGDLLHLFGLPVRTDGRTDGLTKKNSPNDESFSNATPAGGHENPSHPGHHSHTPHVYAVYWPDFAVLKIGISRKARWNAWMPLGGRLIASTDPCCMDHARTIEARMLERLSAVLLGYRKAAANERTDDLA